MALNNMSTDPIKLISIISMLFCGLFVFAGAYNPPKAGIMIDGGVHIDHYNKSFVNKLKSDGCMIESKPGIRISSGLKMDPFGFNIVYSQGKNTFYDKNGTKTTFCSNHISINPMIDIPIPIFGIKAYDKGEGHLAYFSLAPDLSFNLGRNAIPFCYNPVFWGGTYQFKIMFRNGIYFGTGFSHDLTRIGKYEGVKIKEHSFMFNLGWMWQYLFFTDLKENIEERLKNNASDFDK